MDQEKLEKEIAGATVETQMDNGVYRHIRVTYGHPSLRERFEVVTWPGSLAVNGGHGSYVFSRMTDMFEFFRSGIRGEALSPNLDYWAEKLVSGDGGIRSVFGFDPDTAHERS